MILQLLILNQMLLLPKWMLRIHRMLLLQLLLTPLSWSMFLILSSRNNQNLHCHLNLLPCLHPLPAPSPSTPSSSVASSTYSRVLQSFLPFSIESPTPPPSSTSSAPSDGGKLSEWFQFGLDARSCATKHRCIKWVSYLLLNLHTHFQIFS